MLKSYFSYLYNRTAKNSGSSVYSLLEQNKNSKLLDCGCWNGINTKKFGTIIGTKNLYGIEINKEKAKEAAKNGIKVKNSDLNKKFPYDNNSFDVVIAYHVIEHLVNVRLFVYELYRVLKKNGYAVIGTPNLASWHNIFALLLGLQPFSGPTIKPDYEADLDLVKKLNQERIKKVFHGSKSESLDHVKVMTLRALIELLKENKFKIEKMQGFGYYPLFPPISNIMETIDPYHSHYFIVKTRK